MTRDVAIALAVSEDAPALRSIADECGLQVDFQAEFARPYALLLVARSADGVHGFSLAWRAADELHLTDLGITASFRRRGLATLLVRALRAEGERSGARVILLEVRESNAAALALYHGLGFVELDRRARYYADSGEDAVVMQLELS
jgi:[ribosomal protein S18]-alanine N-acetyltransferase